MYEAPCQLEVVVFGFRNLCLPLFVRGRLRSPRRPQLKRLVYRKAWLEAISRLYFVFGLYEISGVWLLGRFPKEQRLNVFKKLSTKYILGNTKKLRDSFIIRNAITIVLTIVCAIVCAIVF